MSYFDDLVGTFTTDTIRDTVIAAGNAISWVISGLPRRARLRALALQVVPETVFAYVEVQRVAIRGVFRDLAEGGWLRALAEQTFGVVPTVETFVTVPITLTNPDALPYSFVAGEVIVQNAVTFETYSNMDPFELDAAGGANDERTVDFIAANPGSIANADAGDISIMSTAFGGVTCTNATVGRASDDESEESLRDRMDLSLASRSPNGAADAYAYLALSAVVLPDGSYALPLPGEELDGAASVGITKVQVHLDDPEVGDVTVYLADADGPPPGADVTGINDLMEALVVPSGVNFLGAFAATPITIDPTLTVTVRSGDGFTEAEVQTFVEEALAVLFQSRRDNPIGGIDGFLYRVPLIAAVERAQPASAGPNDPRPIVNVPLGSFTPSSDTAVTAGEIPILGTVTTTVNFIDG